MDGEQEKPRPGPICVVDIETMRSAEDCRHCGAPETRHDGRGRCMPGDGAPPAEAGRRFAPLGWHNIAALGLSIGCYWDAADERCHFFDRHTLEATMRHMIQRQALLVSFNGIQFDFPLMAACVPRDVESPTAVEDHARLCAQWLDLYSASYDILAHLWRADPLRRFERGLNSLEALTQANGLGAKLSNGAQAPREWQAGRYAQVINYCQSDVYLTKALFDRICQEGTLIRGDGRPLALPHP